MIRRSLPHYDLLTLLECLDAEGEVDEGDEHEIELVEAGEDAVKALEATEESLDLIASCVQRLVVPPGLAAVRIRRHNQDKAQIKRQLARLIALIGAVHDQWAAARQLKARGQPRASLRGIARLAWGE